ncbi:MAG: DctP family TRAP transporter solute-binding subunit [Oscillospiraceae bacterium]|nr:DctP family TRAP transporter solute-binding subunit [Oscillospiraceae bacterium]
MKKTVALLLALVMVFALCACGGGNENGGSSDNNVPVDGKTYTIKIACENSDSYPATLGLYAMEKYVESHTNGAVQVEVCASGQLGGEEDTLEQVSQGTLEMAVASFAPVVSYVPAFEVMDIPFVYNSYEEAWLVLDSYVGTDLLDAMEEYGLKGLAFMENGFRQVTSSQGAIQSMDSFSGLKIRTMQNNNHMAFFQAMGANPTPVPFSELYMALSQKIADAQENPIANVTDKKLYEVQGYLSLTNHIYDAMPLVCNLKFFQSLPTEYQKVVTAGAIYGQEVSRFINAEREGLILADLEKQGMKINEVSADVRAQMAEAAQPAAIELIAGDIGQEAVDAYLASVEEILAQIAKF